jgi:hypothetical protein
MQPIKSYMYTPQEIKLAHELADALEDQSSLSFYLACTKKYSHRLLRSTLMHVMSIPDESIRKSRGALFTHIISPKPTSSDDETDERNDPWY